MLNEGEVGRRRQSMARGGAGVFNHFWDEPEGLEEVTGGRAWPVRAGWDPLVGVERLWFVGGVWGWKARWLGQKGLQE